MRSSTLAWSTRDVHTEYSELLHQGIHIGWRKNRRNLPMKEVYRCDILERPEDDKIPVNGSEFLLTVKPFEIVTVKLTGNV